MISTVPLGEIGRRPRPDIPVLTLAGLVFVIASLGFEAGDPDVDWPRMLLAIAVSAIVAVAVLAALQVWVFRLAGRSCTPLWMIVVSLLFVTIVRSVVLAAVYGSRPTATQIEYRLVVNIFVLLPLLLFLMWVCAYVSHHRRIANELRAEQARVANENERLSQVISTGTAAFSTLVEQIASPAIETSQSLLRTLLGGSGVDPAELEELADRIVQSSDNGVRALSHTLSEAREPLIEAPERAPDKRTNKVDSRHIVASSIRLAKVPVKSLALALTVIMLPIVLRSGLSFATLATLISQAGLAWATAALCQALIDHQRRTGLAGRLAQIAVALTIVGGVVATTVVVGLGIAGTSPNVITWCCVLGAVVLVGWLIALMVGADRGIHLGEQELAAETAQARWYSVLLERTLLSLQREVAETVHGRVQSRFITSAMQLSVCAAQLRANPDIARSRLSGDIESAIATLELARSDVDDIARDSLNADHQSFDGLLVEIAASWRPVIAVSYATSGAVSELLRDVPALQRWLGDLVREVISNAVRHGAAEHVQVSIELVDESLVLVAVDDGHGVDPRSATMGLGTESVVDVGGSVLMGRSASGGAQVTMTLPTGSLVQRLASGSER